MTNNWPPPDDFCRMLQHPEFAFRDPELKRCSIERNERDGQPRPWSGAFAVVYKGIHAEQRRAFAVRVFSTSSPERRERYDVVSEHLKTRRPRCLVRFRYREGEIRATDGKWYPLITMEWVQGETLFGWAAAKCRRRDREAFRQAAHDWIDVVIELADAKIAHGDLQHGNVMVTDEGELKLVDYDCMCVPDLVGCRNLEVGLKPYQHHQRKADTLLSLDLDNFSAMVIYVALRALAADPELWSKYVEETGNDKLLFRQEDFEAPSTSPLVRDLRNSPEEEVRKLTERLFQLPKLHLNEVPFLTELIDPWLRVEELLSRKQWEEAVKLIERRGPDHPPPERLQAQIRQAREHLRQQEAWAEFQKIPSELSEQDDRQAVGGWNEILFAGYPPAEDHRPRFQAACQRLDALERLEHLAREADKDDTYNNELRIYKAARQLPREYKHDLQERVQGAYRRVEAGSRLFKMLPDPRCEADIVDAWKEVVRCECRHWLDPRWRKRIELAEKRLRSLEALRKIPNDLSVDKLDRQLLEAWDEELLGGCPEARPWLPAYETAVRRQKALVQLDKAIKNRNEPEITRLLESPDLENYPFAHPWHGPIEKARERIARRESLIAALREDDRELFYDAFDARIIRQFAERFEPYRPQLSEWTRLEVLRAERLGLGGAVAMSSVVCTDKRQRDFRFRWTWPKRQFSEQCLLAICPHKPGKDDDPQGLSFHYHSDIKLQDWIESGGNRQIFAAKEAWLGSYVVVWALVDLGFQTLYGEPLVLGQLELDAGRPRRRPKGRRIFALLGALISRVFRRRSPAPSGGAEEGADRE